VADLVPLTLRSIIAHVAGSFYGVLYTIYLIEDLHLSPLLLGVVVSAGGVGALVGSEPNGTIDQRPDVLNGRAFTWDLGTTDIANIKYALSTLARIGKHAGATRAVFPFDPGIRLDLQKAGEIDQFDKALSAFPLGMSDIHLTTAHPQGGNGMAGDKSSRCSGRVVDDNFRVDGFDNLFVADASVFPTGITVSP